MESDQTFPSVSWSIRQAIGAIRQMPILFLLTLIGAAVISIISLGSLPANPANLDEIWNAGQLLPSAISGFLNAAILTPMIVATHRLVILGEVTKFSSRDVFSWRFVHFFWLSLVYQAMILAIFFPPALFGFRFLPVIAMVVLIFVVVWMAMRILLVFPAAAVDAPGATIRNAFSDSRGEAWGIFATLFVIVLLLGLINIGTTLVIEAIAFTGAVTIAGLLRILSGAIFEVVSVIALAAAASCIFQGLADRLKTVTIENI